MEQQDRPTVVDLRVGGVPLAVASARPVISWKTSTTSQGWRQASAELSLDRQDQTQMAVVGVDSVGIAWPFPGLRSREEVTLRVRVRGEDAPWSTWSDPLLMRAGFLDAGEWVAAFIGLDGESSPVQPARVRGHFVVHGTISRVTLYATAHGAYQVRVNGREVDDAVLKPGWTSYQHRLLHESTDVTALVAQGDNVVDISLAGGWYTESFSDLGPGRPFYGVQTSAAAQLVIEYADGRTETVATNETWLATGDGPLVASGIYAGETYDARRVSFADAAWSPVRVDTVATVPQPNPAAPVRRIEEVRPVGVIRTPSGKTVLDFGQNLVGRLRVTVSGPAGHTLTVRHAEVMEAGEIATRPLRLAAATDTYTLGGADVETWEPEFTFHGFRYAEIENWPGEFVPGTVVAVVIHSTMTRTGWFECSDPMLEQLHSNAVWGMRSNFLSLPTDCPQRDERFGWTGDIQVFAPAATYLYDCHDFLASWLEDLRLEQSAAEGIVPFIVPDVLGGGGAPIAGWGDAATVVPWTLYQRFGSIAVLRDQFDSMLAWVDAVGRAAGPGLLWESGFQFGDWLDPDAPFDDPAKAKADPGIVSTAQYYRSTRIVADAAAVLGRPDQAARYAALAEDIRRAFLATYVTPAGRMVSDAPTAYALAIAFDIAQGSDLRAALGARLAEVVRSSGYHISTGFLGTPVIQDALTATGHDRAAELLMTQKEYPSWLYPVTMGATTIWERWDSLLEDGSINPGEMTSFNHYALGSVVDWLHRVVAGLAPAAPGYREISIAPRPFASLQHASARHETPYGTAEVGWSRKGDSVLVVTATVPPGSSARVSLPHTDQTFSVGAGSYSWRVKVPPAAPTPPISPSSSLADVVDDPEAYRAVIDAIHSVDPEAARIFRRRTKWVESRLLIDDFTELSPEVKDVVASSIRALAARRS